MTGLIKFDQAEGRNAVRTLGGDQLSSFDYGASEGSNAAPPPPDLDPEVARLREENAQLFAQLEALRAQHEQDLVEVQKEAYVCAKTEFEVDEQASLDLLAEALSKAKSKLKEQIEGLETLTLGIAEAALGNLLGPASSVYSELMVHAITNQVQGLRDGLLTRVVVSPEDFPDPAALAELESSLGLPKSTLSVDPSFQSGSCRMGLQLGHVDFSIPEYWADISGCIRALADGLGEAQA